MRSTGTRPAPSSACGAKVSHNRRAPVLAWTRPAASSPAPWSAGPRSSNADFLPLLNSLATFSMASLPTSDGPMSGSIWAAWSAGFHAVSAGRISVAIPPGAARAAWTARAASPATALALFDSWIQEDTGRAKPTMSEVSSASYCR